MPNATIVTNQGSFTVTLMPEHAPKTVQNFVDLGAEEGRDRQGTIDDHPQRVIVDHRRVVVARVTGHGSSQVGQHEGVVARNVRRYHRHGPPALVAGVGVPGIDRRGEERVVGAPEVARVHQAVTPFAALPKRSSKTKGQPFA